MRDPGPAPQVPAELGGDVGPILLAQLLSEATRSLRRLGYNVVQREDTSLRELIEALREFSLRAPKSAVRMLFYAGHGVQVKGRNYLVPVDADPQSEAAE